MATHVEHTSDFMSALLNLAGNDAAVLRAAADSARDSRGRICLRTLRAEILSRRDPALLSTVQAARDFANAVQPCIRLSDMHRIADLHGYAKRNPASPRDILSRAAATIRNTGIPADIAIEDAINQHEYRLSLH